MLSYRKRQGSVSFSFISYFIDSSLSAPCHTCHEESTLPCLPVPQAFSVSSCTVPGGWPVASAGQLKRLKSDTCHPTLMPFSLENCISVPLFPEERNYFMSVLGPHICVRVSWQPQQVSERGMRRTSRADPSRKVEWLWSLPIGGYERATHKLGQPHSLWRGDSVRENPRESTISKSILTPCKVTLLG